MNKQKVNRQAVFDYVKDKYGSEIEYLWARYPSYAIFRHNDNNKWFLPFFSLVSFWPPNFGLVSILVFHFEKF